MEHCELPELRLSQVEGFYISEISTKMHLASHIHGSVIPWNTLNFIYRLRELPKYCKAVAEKC